MDRRQFVITGASGTAVLAVGQGARAAGDLSVAAVSYPLAYFAERIAGDAAQVVYPVPIGSDPELWRPGVPDIIAFQGADVILLNGAGFAGWIAKASLPRGRMVDTSAGYRDRFIETQSITHSHGNDAAHSHAATATHTWLDPGLAAAQAQAVAAALTRRAPDLEGDFTRNLNALLADLEGISAQMAALSDRAATRRIIASHPRYAYLARVLGIEIASLEWAAGAMPEASDLADLEAMIAGDDAPILLWEAAPPQGAVQALADRGVTGVVFPPLSGTPADGDFLSVLQTALGDLDAALGG